MVKLTLPPKSRDKRNTQQEGHEIGETAAPNAKHDEKNHAEKEDDAQIRHAITPRIIGVTQRGETGAPLNIRFARNKRGGQTRGFILKSQGCCDTDGYSCWEANGAQHSGNGASGEPRRVSTAAHVPYLLSHVLYAGVAWTVQ